jgi:probable F420-dependent oxidoreductase
MGNAPGRPQLGAKLPMAAASTAAEDLRRTIETIAAAGFAYLSTEDHVVGPTLPRGAHPANNQKPLQETFVTLAYAAAIAPGLGLSSGLLILPQRQTALVAKQAAGIDLLSGGRLRLGVGIGWSDLEYRVLGVPWRGRAGRLEEQIDLLRRFWTASSVSASSPTHQVDDAMIAPLPVQRPIPVWIGANSAAGVERAARIADGFISMLTPETGIAAQVGVLRQHLLTAGRDPDRFPVEGWIDLGRKSPDAVAGDYRYLAALGISWITLVPETVPGDLDAKLGGLLRAREAIARAG